MRVLRGDRELGPKRSDIGEIDVRLTHYDEFLACSVETRGVQGLNVIDGGEIGRTDIVETVRSVEVRNGFECLRLRLGAEIVETANRVDHAREGSRNQWISRIREMPFSVGLEAMEFGTERVPNLSCGSTERDPVMRARDLFDRKAPGLQPGSDLARRRCR